MSNSPVIPAAVKLLRSWGVDVQVHDRADSNGRPYTFKPTGVVRHHTAHASTTPEANTVRAIAYGRAAVPGPLAHFLTARDGTVHVLSYGRANHAGEGGPWRNIPANSGNAYLIGHEVDNNGTTEPYPAHQLNTARLVDAACLIAMGQKNADRLLGHKEWAPRRKIDPTYSMSRERDAVARLIAQKTAPPPKPPAKPTTAAAGSDRYVVRLGDTLYSIARKFGTDATALAKSNGITNRDLIHEGQVLKVPAPRTHTVRKGDTLSAIATKYGVDDWRDIAKLNRLVNPDRLTPGQVLHIPAK